MLLNKLDGYDNMEPIRDHFNRVVRESKAFYADPKNSRGVDRESCSLANYMVVHEDLKEIFMEIDSIDDVDKEVANRILWILEPAYARFEPVKKFTV